MERDRVFERPHLVLIEPGASHEAELHLHTERLVLHHRLHGGVLNLIIHVHGNTRVPSVKAREIIQKLIRRIRPYANIYIVIDQEGFRGAVFRSVAAAMVMLAPAGYSLAIRKGLREVLEEVAVRLGVPEGTLWYQYQSWDVGGVRAAMR